MNRKIGFRRKRTEGVRLTLWDLIKTWRIIKNKEMKAKLTSRKFWLTFAGSAIVLFGNQLGLDPELINKAVNLLMSYLIAQGAVDTVKAYKEQP